MPDFERMLEDLYRGALGTGDVAVDVGAHVGRHALPIAQVVGPSGKLYAFEPLPPARRHLEQLFAGHPGVKVLPFALADRDGQSDFVVALDLPAYSGLKTRIYDAPTRLARIQVEVRTLDGLLGTEPRIDYVKIDAEGGELGILRGARELIARCEPLVTFEFGAKSIASYGIVPEDMAAFWAALPYRVYDILGRPLDAESFVRSANVQEVWDYVAVPASGRRRVPWA